MTSGPGDLSRTARVSRRPNASTIVAKASNQGAAASKDADGNNKSNPAPRAPPSTLARVRPRVDGCEKEWISRRYTHALVALPGSSATVVVAFAVTGGMPLATNADSATKLP